MTETTAVRLRKLFRNPHAGLVLCFFFAHGVFHFMGQSFSVLLPSIQQTFVITPVQIGSLITIREIVSGFISLPGGILSDYLSSYRTYVLTVCLLLFGAGWLIIAAAPHYALLFGGMALIAAAGSVWHLPSLVELSNRFPRHRGTVFAIHGAGGSSGDIIGPVATGLLLASFTWREILTGYAMLPVAGAIWTVFLYRRSTAPPETESNTGQPASPPSIAEQLRVSRELLRTTHIWRVNMVAGLRSMCFAVLITFLPLYMHDSGFSPGSIGLHFGLLWAIGLVVSPFMGYASDRIGRKVVLVPALLYSSCMIAALAFWGTGEAFTWLIVLLGLSVRSDYSLINATIIDIVKSKAESTMLGILSVSRHLMGAAAPLIAGALYQFVGMQATFLFVSLLFFLAAIIFSRVDLNG